MYQPHYDARSRALFLLTDSSCPAGGGKNHVFMCGALQSPDRMASLLGRSPSFAPAVVRGYLHRSETVDGIDVPMMLPSDARRVLTGIVWLDLTDDEVGKIDAIELDGSLRKKIILDVEIGDAMVEAVTYLGTPGAQSHQAKGSDTGIDSLRAPRQAASM
jgi:hypothetical protein